jgi:hypothetical protein
MHNILYNFIKLKIGGSENGGSEDSRSHETEIHNKFTKRLIGN